MILIIGCGDIGLRVTHLWQMQGATVHALSHSPQRRTTLEQAGINVHIGTLDDASTLRSLPTTGTLVYYFAPPPEHGTHDPRISNFINACHERLPQQVIYISTSGVYGDCQGAWVTEDTPPNPTTARSRRRLDAETQLLQWGRANNVSIVILRVGGIYGPGRLPVARIKQGLPILRRDLAPYSNRIHADDLAQICVAAAELGQNGRIYNVADGEVSTMSDYFLAVARAAGLPPPPELDWSAAEQQLSAEMLSYLHESRRLDTHRLREELKMELRYPTLEAGLKASLTSRDF
ncbi:MAG: SDR family oxidoreductase [Gammaproteobacteria bacterium]|nr:SDR family oxidoreductase [Gammaproteobacteria bacterium]